MAGSFIPLSESATLKGEAFDVSAFAIAKLVRCSICRKGPLQATSVFGYPSSGFLRNGSLAANSWQRAFRNKKNSNESVLHSGFEWQDIVFSCLRVLSKDAAPSVCAQELYSKEKEKFAEAQARNVDGASDIRMSLNIVAAEFKAHGEQDNRSVITSLENARVSSRHVSADCASSFYGSRDGVLQKDRSISHVAKPMSISASMRVSELTTMLDRVQASGETEELSCRMKESFATLPVYCFMFGELGKKQMWSTFDGLLRAGIKISDRDASSEVFNAAFEVCVTHDAPVWAGKWFCLMLQEGVKPDEITFSLLLPLFRRHNMVKDAKMLYLHMIGLGFNWPAASWSMVFLHVCAGQHEKAKQIYLRMQEANEELMRRVFILELDTCVDTGKVKQAERLVKFLQRSDVKLDLFIYNSMITVNGKAGEHSQAKAWFQRIEEDGLHPNEATYRSIIGSCGRAGRLYDALRFYDRMVALNFSPSIVNYNTLIHLHRKVDHGERIFALLSDMKLAGCIPNSATLTSLVKVYERYKRLDKLPQVLQLLSEAGWEPNEACYKILIRAYIRFNMVDAAMETFSKLSKAAKLEELLCYNLICMCNAAARYDEAIHVFLEVRKSENITPSLRTFCAALDAYRRKGAICEGESLYKQVKSEQEVDSATYNVVLNMYSDAGMFHKVTEVLREILQQKIETKLTNDLCLSMLKVCTKCVLQEEAVKLYWKIAESRIVWTDNLFVGIIHCCGQTLPIQEILKLLNAMMAAKTPLDDSTCNLLHDIFDKAGLLEEAGHVYRLAQI